MNDKNQIHSYDKDQAASFLAIIEANVDNDQLSDEQFRQFIRNSLPVIQKDQV